VSRDGEPVERLEQAVAEPSVKPARRRRGKATKTVQVTFKVPKEFLERFDRVAEAVGYDRTEAIREAMRRFLEESERKLRSAPESAAQALRQVIEEGIVAPLMRLKEVKER